MNLKTHAEENHEKSSKRKNINYMNNFSCSKQVNLCIPKIQPLCIRINFKIEIKQIWMIIKKNCCELIFMK